MNVSDVMTCDVISAKPDASIFDAVRLMLTEHISGLPVIDSNGVLVGIVTEGDFLRRSETATQRHRPRWLEFFVGPGKLASEYVHASGRQVREVMTTDVVTTSEDTSLEEVVRLMERHRIKRLPVVRGNTVIGIVTRANLMRALTKVAQDVQPVSVDDVAIRDRLLSELKKQPWVPIGTLEVYVRNGVVRLSGVLNDEREREALRVAAENTPGVKKVEDEMVWVEPMSGMVVEAPAA